MREDEIEAALLAEQTETDVVTAELMIDALGMEGEMMHRQALRDSWVAQPSVKAYRLYTVEERQLLADHWHAHLTRLTCEGSITVLEREWILARLAKEMAALPYETAPDDLVATVIFLIQGIEGVATGRIPLSWRYQQVASHRRQ